MIVTNAVVDEVNKDILATFDASELVTYHSIDEVDACTPEEGALWPLDFLHSLTPSGMPPHELVLTRGALVMLLRNLDPDAGLCNGVRAIVVRTLPRVLDVVLVSGARAGDRVYIPRLVLAPQNPDLPFVLRRRQFPVKLAWCMTLNKAQGQTLKQVGLYLPKPVFSHGQLYVGLSRAGSSLAVRVVVVDNDGQGIYEGHPTVRDGVYIANVVWQEALLQPNSGADLQHELPVAADMCTESATCVNLHANTDCSTPEEFWDEGDGPTLTPRANEPAQPLDKHGTDDVDEFGANFSLVTMTNVCNDRYGIGAGEATRIRTSQQDEATIDPDILESLRIRAEAHGVGPSEWYEMSSQSLSDLLNCIDALCLPTSAGSASSV